MLFALNVSGAEGRVNGHRVVLGNHRLFEERQLCSQSIHDRLGEMSASGRTPVLVVRDDRPIGIISVADRPRETAKDALDLLRRQGVRRIVLLTGDSQGTAKAIAAELGVDEFRAELLPEDKVAAVEELRRTYGSVAMVGDGVNDAPALATADVGIAMGVAGSDAALETADVALMADELLRIPYAFRLSRATVRNIDRDEGGVSDRRRGRRRDAVDGGRRGHGRVRDRDRERAAVAARGLRQGPR